MRCPIGDTGHRGLIMSVRKIPVMADVTKIAVRIIRYNYYESYNGDFENPQDIICDAAQMGFVVNVDGDNSGETENWLLPDDSDAEMRQKNHALITAFERLQASKKRHYVSLMYRRVERQRKENAIWHNIERYEWEDSNMTSIYNAAECFSALKFAVNRPDRSVNNMAYWARRFTQADKERRYELQARLNFPELVTVNLLGNLCHNPYFHND